MIRKATLPALIFVLCLVFGKGAVCSAEGMNLLQNPGFEEVSGSLPSGWYTDAFINSADAVEFKVEEGNAHSGLRCCAIVNKKPNDSRFCQDVKVEPGRTYKVSYWLKVDNIKPGGGGANITFRNGIYYSSFIFDTQGEWKYFEHYIKTHKDAGEILQFWIRLGGFGAVTEGKVFFDDISIELVESPPAGVSIEECFFTKETGTEFADANVGHKTGTNLKGPGSILVYILAGAAVMCLLVFLELWLAKRSKKSGGGDRDETRNKDIDKKAGSDPGLELEAGTGCFVESGVKPSDKDAKMDDDAEIGTEIEVETDTGVEAEIGTDIEADIEANKDTHKDADADKDENYDEEEEDKDKENEVRIKTDEENGDKDKDKCECSK